MKKEKIYISIDKQTTEPISYVDDRLFCFFRKKKSVPKEDGAEIRQGILEIKIKGIDY